MLDLPAPRVLVTCAEPVGARMAGPAIRASSWRAALAAQCDVTLAAPAPSELARRSADLRLLEAGLRRLRRAARRHTVARRRRAAAAAAAAAGRCGGCRRGSPSTSTTRPWSRCSRPRADSSAAARGSAAAGRHAGRGRHLAAADFVICASEQQRDLWLGGMAARAAARPRTWTRPRPLGFSPWCRSACRRAAAPGRRLGRRCRRSAATTACCCGAAGSGTGSTRRPRSARWRGSPTATRRSTSSSRGSSGPALAPRRRAPRDRRGARARARARARGAARARSTTAGCPTRSGGVAARRRPRRLRPPGAPGVPLRVPDADRSTTCGRGCRSWRTAATRSATSCERAASAARCAPGDADGVRRRVRGAARPTGRGRARGRRARVADELRWDRVGRSRCAISACTGAKRPATRPRARIAAPPSASTRRCSRRRSIADGPADLAREARAERASRAVKRPRGAAVERTVDERRDRRAERRRPSRAHASASTGSSSARCSCSSALSFLVLAALLTKGRPLSGADGLLAVRPAPVLRLDPRGRPPRPDRQPLRPRARRPRRSCTPASRSPAACTPLGLSIPLSLPGLEAGRDRAHVRRRAALRAPPAPARRARHAGAGARAVRGHAGAWLVAWTNWGGNPRQYTFDFISGEMWSGPVPVGLPDDRDRGVPDAARPAGPRARRATCAGPARAARCSSCWLQPWQGATLALIVLAVEALRWLARGSGRRRRACSSPAAHPSRRALLPRCSAASTPPGSSPASRTPPARCRSGAGRGGRSR